MLILNTLKQLIISFLGLFKFNKFPILCIQFSHFSIFSVASFTRGFLGNNDLTLCALWAASEGWDRESLLVIGSVLQKPPNPLFTTTWVYCHRNDSWDPRFNITDLTEGLVREEAKLTRRSATFKSRVGKSVTLKERVIVNIKIKMHEWAMLLVCCSLFSVSYSLTKIIGKFTSFKVCF